MSLETLEVPLFDGLDVPQILTDDTARARRTDPIQSHRAADRSAIGLPRVKRRVLAVVSRMGPRISGNDLNDAYRAFGDGLGWSRIHIDTPRKRAGDMASAVPALLIAERTIDGKELSEAVYTITPAGRAELMKVKEL